METLITSFSAALGWSIIHSLWQAAAIYLILYGIYLVVPTLKSSAKHNLSFIAQLAVLFSFLFTFFNLFDAYSVRSTKSASVAADEMLYYIQYLQDKQLNFQQYFAYIVPLYIVGLVIQAGLCVKDYFAIKKLKKHAFEAIPAEWQESFQSYLTILGLRKKIRLMVSELIDVPVAVGFFKPIVLFPIAYVNQIPLAEAQALILHELTHIKRNDYLLNIIKVSIETILFFNPFIWLLSKHIHTEREQACDDMVINLLPNQMSYAKALLTAELLKQAVPPKWSLAATGKNYKLLNRIKRITNLKMETAYTTTKHQLFTILLVTGALISTAWIKPETVAKESATRINKEISTKTEIHFENIVVSKTDSLKTELPVEINSTQDTSKKKTVLSEIRETQQNSSELVDVKSITNKINEQFDEKGVENLIFQITENSIALTEKLTSAEWKAKVAKIEENAKKIEQKYNSPEFKAKIAQIEENARKIEQKYNSPEFKAKIAQIEENARNIEQKYNSPEWKEKIGKMSEN